jgi:hypothetical protein
MCAGKDHLLRVRPFIIARRYTYLKGNPSRWSYFLEGLPGLRVGIVWAGLQRPDIILSVTDRRRSMPLADMAPLLSVAGCSFVSLQLGPAAAQLRTLPDGAVLHDVSGRLGDWRDTADLISGLDLVIAVDTAVAHLAGALGRPVWLLQKFDADWRWLLDRTDSPWYPTLSIYRQPQPGDWPSVIAAVAADLRAAAQR